MERWTIGEFARRSGLTVKALRLYDEMGLLRPASVDPATGYRGYDADQVPRARLLARLRLAGVPLRDAAPMLDDDAEGRRALLLSHRRRVVADHRIRVDLLDALIVTCDQEVSAMTRTTGTTTQPTTGPTTGP
ncbi:MerR family transcriptional regulator, partial [Nocardioides fonticola]